MIDFTNCPVNKFKQEDCNLALKRITQRIHMDQINRLVEETPFITQLQKDFYKVMLFERKEKILDYSMDLLAKRELKTGGTAHWN